MAHQPLGITDPDYDRVGETLMGILGDVGVPDDIQGRVVDVLVPCDRRSSTSPEPRLTLPRGPHRGHRPAETDVDRGHGAR